MRYSATFLSLLLITAFSAAQAQQQNPGSPGSYASGSRSSRAETPTVRKVREAIMGASGADESTATPAVKNLKVFEKSGKIYLKGTVDSKADKDAIGAKASAAAGTMPVVNRLHVRMMKK